jgi:hypothetical protein
MNLVFAVLHVYKGKMVAIEELGVTRASMPAARFLKDVMVFTITCE